MFAINNVIKPVNSNDSEKPVKHHCMNAGDIVLVISRVTNHWHYGNVYCYYFVIIFGCFAF